MVQSVVPTPNFEASSMERLSTSCGLTIEWVTWMSVEELLLCSQEHLQVYTRRKGNE